MLFFLSRSGPCITTVVVTWMKGIQNSVSTPTLYPTNPQTSCKYCQNDQLNKSCTSGGSFTLIHMFDISPKLVINETIDISPKLFINETIDISLNSGIIEMFDISPKLFINEMIDISPKIVINEITY